MGNFQSAVAPVSGSPVDVIPPEVITNLGVQSFSERLAFNWDQCADTAGDLAGYRVVFGENGAAESLPADRNSYDKIGLSAASGYPFKVMAVDRDGNESDASVVTAVTLLPNPAGLKADSQSGYVNITWDGAAPSEYVRHYAVYISENDFATVDEILPVQTTTQRSAKIAGLTNGQTYFIAVTTVNVSGGENTVVSTIAATPLQDNSGPEISDVKIDGALLISGQELAKPATFTATATDPAGVSRVEFALDGNIMRVDYSPVYSCYWNVVSVGDGGYTLTVTAYDTLGNSTSLDFGLAVDLASPAAPVITQPFR